MPPDSIFTRRSAIALAASLAVASRTSGAFAGAPVTRISVRDAGLVGTLFVPKRYTGAPAVVSLTGAMGGIWEEPAEAIASAGFPTLGLATHNAPGRPSHLSRIPVEYVVDAVAWLRRRISPESGRVALRGWSRGGELALLAASLDPTVSGVVTYAARSYIALEQNKPNNFGDPDAAPAFTWRNAPAIAVPLPDALRSDPNRPSPEDVHGIAVERIRGPILMFSGAADTGLDGTSAVSSAQAAMRRLDAFKSPYAHNHVSYEGAGHEIAAPPPYEGKAIGGGTVAANAAAVSASWPIMLGFLKALPASANKS